MELKFINYQYNDKEFNITINSGTIYGITGKGKESILELISLKELNKGQLLVNDKKITKESIKEFRKKISIIDSKIITHQSNILNIMNDYIIRNNLMIKDPTKKIKDSLKIVGLEEKLLQRDIHTLSASEKQLLHIAIKLLSNPEIIILKEPFKFFDKSTEKRIVMLLERLKEQFKKTIIIASDDSNILYQYTQEMIFIKNEDILLTGLTSELYLRVDYLKKNKFDIPNIVEFTYLAKKKKQVKIDYHKDVRDIIKDIYKHI